ncbi:MAG: adenylosuccinate synthase [Myxococcota bacterium]|nr:adenylosuccinate synthase [Myxococcota bacterium]
MSSVVIVGAQWGDEGKGKVVDRYAARSKNVVRFQGGNNAGHTLVVEGETTVLHLMPSGVLNRGVRSVIGNGVVLDLEVLVREVNDCIRRGLIDTAQGTKTLAISDRAHLILPYLGRLDRARESVAGSGKIGTTGRGIGPTYEDKVGRRGLRVCDLLDPDRFRQLARQRFEAVDRLLKDLGGERYSDEEIEAAIEHQLSLARVIQPFICDTSKLLFEARQSGENILFEGAQGTLLDVDLGTYPYVTSSNCIAGAVCTGAGVGPTQIDGVVGICKAYTTRVGEGPFPTELHDDLGEALRAKGGEFGATTGRPRRCGWLDLVALKASVRANGLTGLALTKMDVLDGLDELKVCTAYRHGDALLDAPPARADMMADLVPVYETVAGWGEETVRGHSSFDQMPAAAQEYVRLIEASIGVPVCLVSVGPDREETMEISDPFGGGSA